MTSPAMRTGGSPSTTTETWPGVWPGVATARDAVGDSGGRSERAGRVGRELIASMRSRGGQ